MSIENTKERYASFAVATLLPYQIIDLFWEIIDNNLKHVFPLPQVLTFLIVNKKDKVSLQYIDLKKDFVIEFDYNYDFNPQFPKQIKVLDNKGKETILLPEEIE